jgi:hypothetical protein
LLQIAATGKIIPFMAMLVLATVAFAVTFHLQMQNSFGSLDQAANASATDPLPYGGAIQESLWHALRLAWLADMNADVFWDGRWLAPHVCFFLLVTIIVNIVMMNVLIAIVGQAQDEVRAAILICSLYLRLLS